MPQVLEAPAIDFAAIKQRQQATWASGDFAVIGTTLQIVGESLAEAADVRAGERVLDVAAGNGNATLAAARRFARRHVDRLRAGAARQGPRARRRPRAWRSTLPGGRRRGPAVRRRQLRRRAVDLWRDVRAGPCAHGQRDAARGARRRAHRNGELDARRLHRPLVQGDRRARAAAGRAAARPRCGARSRTWSSCSAATPRTSAASGKHFNFRYRSAAHWLQVFRDYYGPTHKAFAALDAAARSLEHDIAALLDELNVAAHSLVVPGEYLEVVITKRGQ